MAVTYKSNQIITSGLVAAYDAANSKSGRVGATVWNNLAGSTTNTLINGATFTAESFGALALDGTNDATSATGSISISTQITISVWMKHTTVPAAVQRYVTVGGDIAVLRHDGANSIGQLHFYLTTGGTLKLNLRVNNSLVANQVYNVVGTWDGTTSRLYKQATQIGTDTPGGTLNGGNLSISIASAGEPLAGSIYQVLIYNRALSAAEITQNYNITRTRFGL